MARRKSARRGGIVVGILACGLIASACTTAEIPEPMPAPKAAPADIHPPGRSPVPRPATLEDVPGDPARQRSLRLEEELRRALPAGLRVERVSSSVEPALGSRSYEIGALVTDGTGYGVVLVIFTSPPITSGEPGCFKHQEKFCRILPQAGGDTVSMVDRSGESEQRAITAERFRPDRKLRLTIRSQDGADEMQSRFWRGGPRLGRVPLNADQVVALSGHPGFTPD
ncbi:MULTISPECIES: hypothetical protein [unclassified Crossiella]|uniref:hypothetical protein n=1 Tax=unclassified Crossiella TaxID=2620835 RepID=UPI001FFF4B94|nr:MULTISPECIES: hypothetical protein [unclassified Crossiella]MCK2239174.1 hypothetical protein [Crossiella sp. S99.2]MCK2251257.1 hypothetical protein [Crossiella sp. S99.1]